MQLSSMPCFPCFQFISQRLAQCKLYVVLILSGNEPSLIPAWPISKGAQSKVVRIFRKACELFPTAPEWVTRIASMSAGRQALSQLEARPSDAYLIRRSLIQHEIIFSGEGLTLLNVDHIWTFKHHLVSLSETASLSRDYKSLMNSCVHLLRRINNTYKGIELSESYLIRAYGIALEQSTLKEVCKAYHEAFGEPGVQGLSTEAECEIPQLPELESPTARQPAEFPPLLDATNKVAKLPTPTANTASGDVDNIDLWSLCDDLDFDVSYPKVPASSYPSASPQQSLSSITTTICSRCLVEIGAQNTPCAQEMTMLMSPEWEDFRRIGLGIMKW